MKTTLTTFSLVLLAACQQQQSGQNSVTRTTTHDKAVTIAENQTEVAAPLKNGMEAAPAGDRTPLVEPKGPIDPKSVEAAGQVVQHYGALIEQHRWSDAEQLWGSATTAAQFDRELRKDLSVHLEIGDLSDPEGAAGSIYVTMPVVFTSTGGRGGPVSRKAEVTLRRVNDVPGSTETQRHWHIERIDWKG